MTEFHLTGPLRVLALDPSYEATGYALLDGECRVLRSGTFQATNTHASQRQRAHEIAWHAGHFVQTYCPLVDFVAIEEPPLHGTPTICKVLSRLNGAICYAITRVLPEQVRIQDMNIDEWRKAVGFVRPKTKRGDKDANKKLKAALLAHAQKRWPHVEFGSVDAAEAALIGLRYVMHVQGTRPIVVKPKKVSRKA